VAAYLVAVAGSTVAPGHRQATHSAVEGSHHAMDDPGTNEGTALARTDRLLTRWRGLEDSTEPAVPSGGRQAGPREHGRQAARSKRDRPRRANE